MTADDLHAEADRRVDDAVTEGLDQLAKGWRPAEVLAVLEDAAAIVGDLRDQADATDELEQLIRERDELVAARVRGFGWVEDLGGGVMSQHAFESLALILIVLAIGGVILCAGLGRAAAKPRPPMNTVPAGDTPPSAPARALTDLQMCYQRGHVYAPWAKTATHWVCCRCGNQVKRLVEDDLPYDQEAVAVFDAARAITRQAAGGAA